MPRNWRMLATSLISIATITLMADPAGAAPARIPAPTDQPPVSTITYEVRPGDHLLGIARKAGITLTALLDANGLTVTSVIHPGDQLVVPVPASSFVVQVTPRTPAKPAPGSTTYTVRAGDYLVGIAARNGVTLGALLRANDLEVTSTIVPGRVLLIPPPTLPIPATAPIAPRVPVASPVPVVATVPPSAEPSPLSTLRTFLEAQLGKPYEFNSSGPDSYDCSGLVVAGFAQIGIRLPHQSLLLSSSGTAVEWTTEQIEPGDLIFVFSSATPGQIGHVGIALTSTTWIQAVGTGIPVRTRPIPSDDKIRAVRRVL